jgi:hypothetical protein
MNGVQLVIAPAYDENGNGKIIVGFHNEYFSQSVNLPFTNYTDTMTLASELYNAILKAGHELTEEMDRRNKPVNQLDIPAE